MIEEYPGIEPVKPDEKWEPDTLNHSANNRTILMIQKDCNVARFKKIV